METAGLVSSHVNSTWEILPTRLSSEETAALDDLFRFYSPFGVIRKVVTYFGSGGALPAYVGHGWYYDFDHVLQRMTGLSGLSTAFKRFIYAGGKGETQFRMLASTLGELVERVLGSLEYMERANQCVYGTRRQLLAQGYNCLGPDHIHLFAPEQYGQHQLFDPFTDDSMLGWIEGRRLISGESVWLPAQLVLLFYRNREDETAIGYGTTGGLATHINEREALYHGITELFERDAMNVTWYSHIPPQIIDIDRPLRRGELRRMLAVASGLPGTLTFYLHTLDVPEIAALTVIELDDWLNRYAYYSGGGVDLDVDTCMLSAFNEFVQAERNMRLALAAPDWRLAQSIDRFFDVKPDAELRSLNLFFKVVPYYGYPQNTPKLDWYLNTPRRVRLSSLPVLDDTSLDARWDALLKMLERHCIDPIVFDFTPPQMEQVRLKKVYIAELTGPCPPSSMMLGHPRYYELPERLGFAKHRLSFAELNPHPLPYP